MGGVSTEALNEVVLAEAKPSAPVSIIGDAVEQDIEKVTVPLWRSWVGSMKAQRWTRRLRAQRRQGRRAVVWFGNGGSTYTGGIRAIAKRSEERRVGKECVRTCTLRG